jgi:hypothetical protein
MFLYADDRIISKNNLNLPSSTRILIPYSLTFHSTATEFIQYRQNVCKQENVEMNVRIIGHGGNICNWQ